MKHLLNSIITTDLQKIMKVGIYIGEKQKYYIFSWNSAWTYSDSYKWNLYTINLVRKTGRWTDLQSHLDYYKSHRILIFMPKVWRIFYFRDEAFSSSCFGLYLFILFCLPVCCVPMSCLLFFIFVNHPWYLFYSRILLTLEFSLNITTKCVYSFNWTALFSWIQLVYNVKKTTSDTLPFSIQRQCNHRDVFLVFLIFSWICLTGDWNGLVFTLSGFILLYL